MKCPKCNNYDLVDETHDQCRTCFNAWKFAVYFEIPSNILLPELKRVAAVIEHSLEEVMEEGEVFTDSHADLVGKILAAILKDRRDME